MRRLLTRRSGWIRLLTIILALQLADPPVLWALDREEDERRNPDQRTLASEPGTVPRPAMMALAEPINPDKYICGPGDLFMVQVWGIKELSLEVPITAEGEMFIPTVGKIAELAGKSLAEVKRKVRGRLGWVYKDVSYDVFLTQPRHFIVYVAGFAKNPGEHRATAVTTVSQLLRDIGGPNANGSRRVVEVWRNKQLLATVDFFRMQRFGETDQDLYVLDGDLIKVPPRGKRVTIAGAVKAPGDYELREDEDLKTLIDVQGAGFDSTLSRRDEIEVTSRHESEQFRIQRVPLSSLERGGVALHDLDRVLVPTLDRYQRVIRVQGAVNGGGGWDVDRGGPAADGRAKADAAAAAPGGTAGAPGGGSLEHYGVYPYIQGETTYNAILRAGGVTPFADTEHAFIRRPAAGDAARFDIIPVNLTAVLIDRDFSKDVVLKEGDYLVVPTLDYNVFVSGEVTNPGTLAYVPYYNARYYLGMSGGATSRASLGRSKIIHRDGAEEDLDLNAVVQPGDTIQVQEKTFKFWQDYWTIVTGTAALVLSGFAVLYAYGNK